MMVASDSATLTCLGDTAGSGSATRPQSTGGLSTRYLWAMVRGRERAGQSPVVSRRPKAVKRSIIVISASRDPRPQSTTVDCRAKHGDRANDPLL